MTYAQGGLIQATDYNNFINGSNQFNTVWNVGTGDAGYGQTAISTVSAAGLVTATQWATLINSLNSALTHQSGSGSGISATTAGTKINYLSTLATNINTAYTNRVNWTAQGTTTTGATFSPVASAALGTAYNATVATRSITFASGDAARYFFNCGGQLNFVISSVTNNDSTARSTDAVNLLGTGFGGWSAFRQTTSAGKTGSYTATTNSTTTGYYDITATAASTQLLCQIASPNAPYTTDVMYLYVYSSAQNVSGHADKGATVYFQLVYNSPAHAGWNDTLNVTVNHRIDIVYPETTNLTNSWGTPTVA